MKKTVLILFLLLIIAGLAAGIALMNNTEGAAESINPNLVLLKLDENEIKSVKLKNQYGENNFSFYADSGSPRRLKPDIYKALPVHNGNCQTLLNSIKILNAVRNFGETEKDKGYYGLDTPYAVVTVTLADNSQKTVTLGKLSPDKKGRYASLSDNKNIFLVNSAAAEIFAQDSQSFLSLNLFGVYTDEEAMKVKQIVLGGSCRDKEIIINNEKSEYSARIFKISQPVKSYCNDENVAEFCAMLTLSYSADRLEVLNPSADELEKYGLSDPYSTVRFIFADKEEYVAFGKTDKGLFAAVNNIPAIYRLNNEDYSFIGLNLKALSDSALFSCIVRYIDSIEISSEGKSDILTSAGNIAQLNGKDIDYSKFKNYYALLLDSLSKSVREKPENTPQEVCRLKISFNYDRESERFIYYKDKNSFFVSVNGGGLLKLDSRKAEKFLSFNF